ncbi:hypothetical protein M569_15289, partial [Genlisea aurea]
MAGVKDCGSVLSLPPPRPKSPPEYPDLFGKRRELGKVQMLEREIGFLREELKSIEGIEPASRSCKELADFVTGNLDPLLPASCCCSCSCSWKKWICALPRFLFSCICCCRCCRETTTTTAQCCCVGDRTTASGCRLRGLGCGMPRCCGWFSRRRCDVKLPKLRGCCCCWRPRCSSSSCCSSDECCCCYESC